uniref:Pentatricopeptide repeat-containing protein n=1 Tax=Tanacetum cinerariifolium TaxID=118510 RepID=A0A6L2MZ07_TANCI|nr:hypothetical protein [Tanacetum cinerariifolium]
MLKFVFVLEEFARVLHVPCQGVCMFSNECSISSLPNCIDPNPSIYLPPIEYPKVETILSKNALSLSGNKDHPNVCMAYMLYCLSIQKPFNLAYYIAKRMESVTRSDVMVLPYGMLLTHLYRHVHTTHPYAISDNHHLVDHIMIPLTEWKVRRIMVDGKRPHPQTHSDSSLSPSPTQNQEENDPVDNYTLDPIFYMNQLPSIEGGESLEFKQTKGILKCFGYFLSNLGNKK